MARPPIPTPGLVPFHTELNAVLSDAQTSLDGHDTAIAGKVSATQIDTDAAMAANSDSKVASQKAVKTALDSRVPTGGVRGQVLTVGASGRAMADVPGIVYPSLLLSPDGSFDRSGAVTPTVGAGVSVVAGTYGNSWSLPVSGSNTVTVPQSYMTTGTGTVLARLVIPTAALGSYIVSINGTSGLLFGALTADGKLNAYLGAANLNVGLGVLSIPRDVLVVLGMSYSAKFISTTVNGAMIFRARAAGSASFGSTITLKGEADRPGYAESVLFYPNELPPSEIARIAAIPAAWTMVNAAANTYHPTSPFQQFSGTNKIAVGGATARTAPGAATQAIATLAAGTLVSDTGQRQNVSSVDYAMLWTQEAGICWAPLSTVTTL